MEPKILAFAGSNRKQSFNKKLVKIAAQGAKSAGAEVTYVDLRDYPMPLYDGDLEESEGIPETVRQFKKLMKVHSGFLIATPEYNGAITPLLKNVIDWASRPEEGEERLACFKNKVAVVMSTSPGGLGGLQALNQVRSILSNIGVFVLPDKRAIPNAFQAFDENGTLVDPAQQESIELLGTQLATICQKLSV